MYMMSYDEQVFWDRVFFKAVNKDATVEDAACTADTAIKARREAGKK